MSTFTIAGKDFYQYVAYRLKKDGLGYTPSKTWTEGCTDTKTFIKAILPQTAYDFLVYCHELGHCKSKQFPREMGATFFGGYTCDNTLYNEFNAWVWAIRYMRKLKMSVAGSEMVKALNDSFRTYTRQAANKSLANDLLGELNTMLGIDLAMEKPVVKTVDLSWASRCKVEMGNWTAGGGPTILGWYDEFFDYMPKKREKVVPQTSNKEHRPWMDLLDKKRKHSWKNKK